MKSKRKVLANSVICIGLLFIAAALSLAAYNVHGEMRAKDSVKEVLEILKPEIPNYDDETVSEISSQSDTEYSPQEDEQLPLYILNPEIEMPVITVNTIEYIGILNIPSLNLELPVIGDWSYDNLKAAPCCYSGSAYNGNFVILAHNYMEHFGSLQDISEGDKVVFTDVEGNTFNYKVDFVEVLQPTDVDEMISDDYDLTLFTCNFSGQARVTVRCSME